MPRFIDLTGQRFGRLIVVKRSKKDKRGNSKWLCLCDCDKEKIVYGFNLKGGHTQSCGCFNREQIIRKLTTHGHTKGGKMTRTYRAWHHMIERCTNQNDRKWKDYGDRGITVCERWLKFENFLEDMGECPEWRSIDRIDNDGNYCSENCRWATIKQQNNNSRHNHMITFNNRTQTLTEWSKEIKISPQGLLKRFELGWSIKKALTQPVRKTNNGDVI